MFRAKETGRPTEKSKEKTVFHAGDSLRQTKTKSSVKSLAAPERPVQARSSANVKPEKQPAQTNLQAAPKMAARTARSPQKMVAQTSRQPEVSAAKREEKAAAVPAAASGRTIRRSGQTVVGTAPASLPQKQQERPKPPKPAAQQAKRPVQKKQPERPVQAAKQNANNKKKRKKQPLVIVAVLVLMLAGIAAVAVFNQNKLPSIPQKEEKVESASGFPVQVGDRQVDARPERIVSLSPMLTQALLSLPGHEALCGVTEYCRTDGEELPTVGTPLLPRADRIKELAPQYVLCQTPIPDAAARSIEESGARIIQLPPAKDLESLRELYAQLGALLLGNETGRPLGTAMIDRLEDSLARCRQITGGEKTALLLPDLSGAAATEDTAEWALLGQVFRHPVPDASGWMADAAELADEDPNNDLEPIRRADPDLLLLPTDLSPELLNEKLGDLRAVQQGAVVWYDRQTAENLSPQFLMDIVRGVRLVCPQAFELAH